MNTLKIVPVEDRLICDPNNNYAPVKAAIEVPSSGFWRRALIDGDVALADGEAVPKWLEQLRADEARYAPAADDKPAADVKGGDKASAAGVSGDSGAKPPSTPVKAPLAAPAAPAPAAPAPAAPASSN